MVDVRLVAPPEQVELVLGLERPLHDEGVVKIGVSDVLHHQPGIYEGRFFERLAVEFVQFELRLELRREVVHEIGESGFAGGGLQKRADLLVDDLHYRVELLPHI